MNYSTVLFIALLPAFAALYWSLRAHAGRLLLLLASSLAFYAYGDLAALFVLLGVAAITYLAGIGMARWDERADLIAAAATLLLVADLALFKYGRFINEQVPSGIPRLPELIAPLGISFYTFSAISYVLDVKRGMIDVERSPLRIALFLSFFPKVISGPIMRADDLLSQLKVRATWDAARFTSGVQLFVEGLVKKRLIADPVGAVVDSVFAAPAGVATAGAWIGVLAFAIQLYADFAGYTDMARGTARILGLELPSNFNAPYVARSVTDFWRRWHITLSTWLRDYVWIPLGGLRHGRLRPYVAVFLTMVVAGVWHGAGWSFAIWGAYHGAWLAFERRVPWWERVPRWLAAAITFFIVVNGFVLFRSTSLDTVGTLVAAMYLPRDGWLPEPEGILYAVASLALVLGAMTIQAARPRLVELVRVPRAAVGVAYGLGVIAALVVAPTPTPFIYFRF